MSSPKEEAAGVLDTPATADRKTCNAIVTPAEKVGNNEKHTANIIAAFALAGLAVQRLEGESFLVSRWNLTKHCPDLRTLIAFAKQAGVRT